MLYLLLSQIPCIWLAQHYLLHLPLVDYQLMVCFFYNFLRHSTQWGLFTLVIVNIELLHGEWTGVLLGVQVFIWQVGYISCGCRL